ncbi:fibroblast growth factor-binding protein 3 [Arapaima gigas]
MLRGDRTVWAVDVPSCPASHSVALCMPSGWASIMKLSSTLGLLLCLSALCGTEGKRNSGRGALATMTPESESVPISGELLTRGKHKCTWETSGADVITLQIRCTHEEGSYQCQYTGLPNLCSNYKEAPRHYWEQVVRRLKKKTHACERNKVLKAGTCKLAPPQSHMTQVSRSRTERQTEKQGKESRRKGSRPRGKEKKPPKKEKHPSREMNDMEPEETYCAEGWNTVCTFFLKFFNG